MKKSLSAVLYVVFFAVAAFVIITSVSLLFDGKRDSIDITAEEELSAGDFRSLDSSIIDNNPDYEPIKINKGYNALENETKKYLYNEISRCVYSLSSEKDQNNRYRTSRIEIKDNKMTEFDIKECINAYLYDNPEVFWIENLYGYAYTDKNTIIEFYSHLSTSECEAYITNLNERIREILSKAQSAKNDYQKEKLIHDELLSGCSYKTGITGSGDGWEYFTTYGALVNGEAVCEGYAKSMQLLLTQAGLECTTVRGIGDGTAHLWNYVRLDGKWYHLDPTWDDNSNEVTHEYFNMSTEQAERTHTISENVQSLAQKQTDGEQIDSGSDYNFFIAECDSRNMNYYYVEGILIDTFDKKTDKTVVDAMVRAAKNGTMIVPIRFGGSKSFDEYMNDMFYDKPFKFYFYADQANKQLDKSQEISKDSISVLKNSEDKTLRIRMNYSSAQ